MMDDEVLPDVVAVVVVVFTVIISLQ